MSSGIGHFAAVVGVNYASMATPLSKWLLDQIGPTKRFKSSRHFSLAMGLNQNQIGNMIEKGTAAPETLIKIADGMGVRRTELFQLAGWLRPEDVDPNVPTPLAPDEQWVLDDYRVMDQWAREMWRGLGSILLGRRPRPDEPFRMVEES